MKNKIIAAISVAAPFAVLAEDPAISTPDGILTAAQTALSSLLTTALPIVGALVVTGLTLWGAFKLLRLIMKAFGFGTSR